MSDAHTLVCCCTHGGLVSRAKADAVVTELETAGEHCLVVDDLCGLAAKRDPTLMALLAQSDLTVMACRPRAVRGLLSAAGDGRDSADGVQYRDLRDAAMPGKGTVSAPCDGWMPWFPVIDYDRCRDCGQCLDFCLFGVYAKDAEGRVQVVNPAACKTNCPACARICPEAAIMFPKHAEPPIDGSEISNEDAVRAKMKINVDEVLGSDVYRALAERRRESRKRLLDRQKVERALAERRNCSVKKATEA